MASFSLRGFKPWRALNPEFAGEGPWGSNLGLAQSAFFPFHFLPTILLWKRVDLGVTVAFVESVHCSEYGRMGELMKPT